MSQPDHSSGFGNTELSAYQIERQAVTVSKPSHKQIEEIAAAVTKDFNEFFFGKEANDVRIARATPIDQFAKDYLGLDVSFARLSRDGSICGLTAYADTEYITEEMGIKRAIPLRQNQVLLDESFIRPCKVRELCSCGIGRLTNQRLHCTAIKIFIC